MGSWNEASAGFYRDLEKQQRALAADASAPATRDIHLEFADKYQRLAEQLEAEEALARGSQPASES